MISHDVASCVLQAHLLVATQDRDKCARFKIREMITELVPRRRRGGRVLDRQYVAWASGGVGAERRAACDAACESLGTWIRDLGL